jgi:aminoglycoside phosphotransferase (APT) family kinase protein
VHPDFQPGNIGICPSGTVVFFDWGAATFSHPFISLGQFMSCTGLGLGDVGAYLRHWTRYADLDELAALARRACGDAGIPCELRETVHTWSQEHRANAVFRVNGTHYLKIYGPTAQNQFHVERGMLQPGGRSPA